MQVSPQAYAASNTFQTRDALNVIHRVKDKYPDR